jgi:hypothetical protein
VQPIISIINEARTIFVQRYRATARILEPAQMTAHLWSMIISLTKALATERPTAQTYRSANFLTTTTLAVSHSSIIPEQIWGG